MPFCLIEWPICHSIRAPLPYDLHWAGRLACLARSPVVVGQGERQNSTDHLSNLSTPLWRPFEVVEDRHDDAVVLFR